MTEGTDGTGVADDDTAGCAFCRLPVPDEPVEATVEGVERTFCSASCRDRLVETGEPFDDYADRGRVRPGVSALDASLPQGFPRNAFVLVSGEAGTRDRALGAELVWRALQRGEPVVFVSFQEPPSALVQQFLTLEWNVLPYLEREQFHIVDCFTYRLDDRDRLFDRMDDWNAYLSDVARDATTTVRDPSDINEVGNKLDNALEKRGMVDEGLVIVDSLTELGTLVQPVQAYDFVKDIRADVCKGRFVPVFAGATIGGGGGGSDQFPHDLTYVMDGLVELRLNDDLVENALVKQARIRKLNGAIVVPEWQSYEYTAGTGMVTFDPEAAVADEPPAEMAESPAPDEGPAETSTTPDRGDEAATTAEAPTGGDGAAAESTPAPSDESG
ncbi:RAD55 family ATPase [Halosegnis sp.]|uniref:RAD55 family ATPase n=1 Tax=Halosegnis sp. TaxID=2864959 RepID=UPI0035D49A18